ncbi:MAG: hypothetical protein C5B50_02245 [Verrucomicrobia bacterium]|nr:MAG: hypothetical protein C5B50_02245 [Verrucomicrobiota bacterium]
MVSSTIRAPHTKVPGLYFFFTPRAKNGLSKALKRDHLGQLFRREIAALPANSDLVLVPEHPQPKLQRFAVEMEPNLLTCDQHPFRTACPFSHRQDSNVLSGELAIGRRQASLYAIAQTHTALARGRLDGPVTFGSFNPKVHKKIFRLR